MRPSKKPVFAKKSLGQNFLVDISFISQIIDSVNPTRGEPVVEIGPGRGALTAELLDRGAKVVAIEFDRDMTNVLRERFSDTDRLEIVDSDALTTEFAMLLGDRPDKTRVKLVANLPYNISTAILQRLIIQRHLFSNLVLMLQREVVERLAAKPGNSERGFLTVLAEAAFTIERLFYVPPDAFRPRPKVWSSVIRLTPRDISIFDTPAARQLISNAFKQKRKTLHNNLKAFVPDPSRLFETASLDPGRRAETLSNKEWESLINSIQND